MPFGHSFEPGSPAAEISAAHREPVTNVRALLLACSPRIFHGLRRLKRRIAGWASLALGLARRLIPLDAAQLRILDEAGRSPAWVPRYGIDLVARLNAALRALRDEEGENRRLHYRWVEIFHHLAESVGRQYQLSPRFHCVWLGAGVRNPYAFAALLFLWGAERIYIVEPDPGNEVDQWQALWGLQETVLRLMSGNISSPYFRRSVAEIGQFVALDALYFGSNMTSALNPEKVIVINDYFENCSLPRESVDLIVSRSVLEHVKKIGDCCDRFATILKPGGVMYHDIDLTAHSGANRFAFYYDAGANQDLNGLRLSDYVRLLESRGLPARVMHKMMEPQYVVRRDGLQPRYRNYDEEDLRCSRTILVAQKPARKPC